MLEKIIASKKLLIFLGIMMVIAVVLSLIKPKGVPPTITATSPASNARRVSLLQPIEFKFKNSVNAADFSAASIPEASWNIEQPNELALTLTHPNLLTQNTKYVVSLYWQKKLLTTLAFTTEETQTDHDLLNKLDIELKRDYPLANFTPHETSSYTVVYASPLTLAITIKNPNLTSQEAINEVKSWVTSQGGNVAAHKFVVAP